MTDTRRVSTLSIDHRWREWRAFMALARFALANGATRDGPLITWSTSAKSKHPCLNPRFAESYCSARKSEVFDFRKPATPQAIIRVYARCRRCAGCLHQRRVEWVSRCIAEHAQCPGRVWFVTLTSAPIHREFVDRRARLLAHGARAEFERDPFKWRALALRPELSLYLKRVRNGVGRRHRPRFRFVAVVEPHTDDHAHAHLLVFEHSPDAPLTERLLRGRWERHGHAAARLCDKAVSAYVSKYLSKDPRALVQASKHFGKAAPRLAPGRRALPPSGAPPG